MKGLPLILNDTNTNDYFFQQGREATCRYILKGAFDSTRQAQSIQSFFVRHRASLELYLAQHQWPITAQDILSQVHVETRDDRAGSALWVDIPHYLVDAQRGLLCIDAAFKERFGTAELPVASTSRYTAEPFTVHSIALADFKCSAQQTLTQAFLASMAPLLTDGIRLVQNLESRQPSEVGFGNCFATLDLDHEQLNKLARTDKLLWKRFLDRTAGQLRAALPRSVPMLPDRQRPLFTSVGKIPSAALPLPNLAAAIPCLYMFPSQVPLSRFTMTLYSYGSRLYFILSGQTENVEQRAITQLLLGMGWVIEATGE